MSKINQIISFFKEARGELKKVVWPNRKTVIRYTLIVVGVSLAMAAFLGTLDLGFGYLLKFVV